MTVLGPQPEHRFPQGACCDAVTRRSEEAATSTHPREDCRGGARLEDEGHILASFVICSGAGSHTTTIQQTSKALATWIGAG
jgi:hypothetical protein